jgi:hypothetical protein
VFLAKSNYIFIFHFFNFYLHDFKLKKQISRFLKKQKKLNRVDEKTKVSLLHKYPSFLRKPWNTLSEKHVNPNPCKRRWRCERQHAPYPLFPVVLLHVGVNMTYITKIGQFILTLSKIRDTI